MCIIRLYTGDLSMEVVCYIWDQCLIGLDNPSYQCLPYYITVWLILLRKNLMKGRNVSFQHANVDHKSKSGVTSMYGLYIIAGKGSFRDS